MSIPDLASELWTQRSRHLLDSASWKPHDHPQLRASLPELIILARTQFSLSAPASGPVSPSSGWLPSQGIKAPSCSLPQNLLQGAPYSFISLLLTIPWLIPASREVTCFLCLFSSTGSGSLPGFPFMLAYPS